ncbi:ZIP family metal transporter [Bacillus timonensis]|nr:ZIP family metal transporter [Bacillus timonensis]
MWEAVIWGAVAGSAVLAGAIIGIFVPIKKKLIGYIMAFGTGVLLGAASFELLADSIKNGGFFATAVGFLFGAALFTTIDLFIAYKGGKDRKRSNKNPKGHSGIAIFIGTVIDAIPESVIIGISLIDNGISWVLVIAIFISNFPEGLSSSIGLKKDGYSTSKILFLWFIVFILSSVSSLVGYTFLNNLDEWLIAGINAFAAGGIVAMVSSTMLPEAYEEGGPVIGILASFGLIVAVYLTTL